MPSGIGIIGQQAAGNFQRRRGLAEDAGGHDDKSPRGETEQTGSPPRKGLARKMETRYDLGFASVEGSLTTLFLERQCTLQTILVLGPRQC